MNFINKNVTDKDKDLFFGPVGPTDFFIEIKDNWIMAHIIKNAGIFPSTSQAKKNGWDKEIPKGFTELMVGKKAKRKNIFILNI